MRFDKRKIYKDDVYGLNWFNKNNSTVRLQIMTSFNKFSTLDEWTFELELNYSALTGTFFLLVQNFTGVTPVRLQIVPAGTQINWRDSSNNNRFLGNVNVAPQNKIIFSYKSGVFFKNITNGVKASNTTPSQCSILNSAKVSNDLTIGIRNLETDIFIGSIKNVRFFTKSLDDGDENLLINNGNFLSKENLPSYLRDNMAFEYRCNQRNGDIVKDTSGNNVKANLFFYDRIDTIPNGNAWQPI